MTQRLAVFCVRNAPPSGRPADVAAKANPTKASNFSVKRELSAAPRSIRAFAARETCFTQTNAVGSISYDENANR
jgi:hypothetical protein